MGEGLRRRIIRRLFENSRDWICRTVIRITRNAMQLFLLLGEKVRLRASVKTKFIPPIVHPKMISGNRVPFRRAGYGRAAEGEFSGHYLDA